MTTFTVGSAEMSQFKSYGDTEEVMEYFELFKTLLNG